MQHDFPYQPGYIGELDTFSPEIAEDLRRLLVQLDPQLEREITSDRVPHFRGDQRFRQIVAVEERGGRPTVVGTANISFVQHSYEKDGTLSTTPTMALGSFVVDESVRGKGIAVRIWNHLLDVGAAEGVRRMQFTSKPARSAAHGFYAKMGAEQFTPIYAVKYKADGTETTRELSTPLCDEQFELAKGHVVFVFSETGTEQVPEDIARALIANYNAERFEQLIPTKNLDKATTVLFSCDF